MSRRQWFGHFPFPSPSSWLWGWGLMREGRCVPLGISARGEAGGSRVA